MENMGPLLNESGTLAEKISKRLIVLFALISPGKTDL